MAAHGAAGTLCILAFDEAVDVAVFGKHIGCALPGLQAHQVTGHVDGVAHVVLQGLDDLQHAWIGAGLGNGFMESKVEVVSHITPGGSLLETVQRVAKALQVCLAASQGGQVGALRL